MIANIAYAILVITVIWLAAAYIRQSRKLDKAWRELSQAKSEIEVTKIHLNRVYSDLMDALGEE